MIIRPATADEVVPLRHAVLRAGLPRETAVFPGDESPAAKHFVAVDGEGAVVGCLTLHLNAWRGAAAYQLRGMATAPDRRRAGLGRALLQCAEAAVRGTDVRTLWCNARTPAVPFYTAMGWHVVSPPFDIPTAGPHVKMVRTLAPA